MKKLAVAVSVFVVAVLVLERKRPLRRSTSDVLTRWPRNAMLASFSGLVVQTMERPVAFRLCRFVERRRFGLLARVSFEPLRRVLGVVLLDYTLYVWHVLTHKVPLLWRFHSVHHYDQDLDASTSIRFHAGEMVLSVPWRALQIVVLGVDRTTLDMWHRLLFASIWFHHSNVDIDERWIRWLITTPRLHGCHHSMDPVERESNWSSGLVVWDWLHGTLRTGDPVAIGLPGGERQNVVSQLAHPFGQRD